MQRLSLTFAGVAAALFAADAFAQSSLTPLASFGTSGWLAPGSSTYLTIGNTERGLAYNPVTGNLLLVSRASGNNVRVLQGLTGIDLGGFDLTGVAGGTFAANMIGCADDGSIYMGNLSTSATSNFRVYSWPSEAAGLTSPPALVYDAPSGMARTGDSFAIRGGLTGPVRFAAAGSSTVNNSGFVVGRVDGTNTSTAYLSIPGTTAASNDYRLGLTWVDDTTVIGSQGGAGRYTTFDPVAMTATLAATIPLSVPQRAMSFATVGGTPVLAVLESTTSILSVLDITNPAQPVVLASATATSGALSGNANATGSVQWGAISGNTAVLYAMNTNHGIQAFSVVVQPAASATAFGTGCGSPAMTLSATAAPILPSTIQLTTDNLPVTGIFGFYAYGFTAIPGGIVLPIPPNCTQYIVPIAQSVFVPLMATSYQQPQSFPNDPAYAGLQIFVQSLLLDTSSDVLTTNGLRLYLETF